MAGVRVLASPHPNQPTGRVRTKKKKEPARTTPKPTGWPGCAPKTGNQRAPSSGATPFFQHPPFLDKYAGNKKITIERVAVTRRAVSPSNAKDLVFGLCLCLLAPSHGAISRAPAGVAAPRSRTRCGGEDCPSRRGRISCGPPSLLSRPLRSPASPSASPDAKEKKRTTGSFPPSCVDQKIRLELDEPCCVKCMDKDDIFCIEESPCHNNLFQFAGEFQCITVCIWTNNRNGAGPSGRVRTKPLPSRNGAIRTSGNACYRSYW